MGIKGLLSLVAVVFLGACAVTPVEDRTPVDRAEIAALEAAFLDLGAGVDPEEAARAARIAHEYPRQLAVQYGITDPPLIHNTKVNMGLRDRGLCWHWADDMQARMHQEAFQSLDLHRAIANSDRRFRLEHSTLIISARGDETMEGIVLDPWRKGGILFWSPAAADPDYDWIPRDVVFARLRATRRERRQGHARQRSGRWAAA